MDFRHYTDRAVMLATELVQTFSDPERTVGEADLRPILHRSGIDAPLAPRDVAGLREVAAELRQVFAADSTEEAVTVLNQLIDRATPRPHISDHNGRGPHLHFARPQAPVVERVRTNAVMALAVVVCDYGRERLGTCDAIGCPNVFVDISRNPHRRYCSDACANRSNVAAHRARRRQLGSRADPPPTELAGKRKKAADGGR
jgi:predicted RNA-binding Zn ribbon-like protein